MTTKNQTDLTYLKQILKVIDPNKKVFPQTQTKIIIKETHPNPAKEEK